MSGHDPEETTPFTASLVLLLFLVALVAAAPQ
jgi:hypothetical protein